MQEYPFPIPKTIEKDVLANIAESSPPWGGLDEWSEAPDDLTSFGYFYCWRCFTRDLVENLKRMLSPIESRIREDLDGQETWRALEGTVYALDNRLHQFAGLLEWARQTWKYDPAVLELIDGNGSKDTSPDETPEGAGGGLQ